jgi:5'-phosphate synthase pdxT subunit
VAGFQGDIEENVSATRQALQEIDVLGNVKPVRYPQEIQELDGLIIPGGESTVISTMAAIHASLPVIKKRISDGMPVLGTCAGMIMLSRRAFDRVVGDTKQKLVGPLDIVIERNAFGRQNDSFEADLAIPTVGSEPFKGVFIRAPAVTEIGPNVEILAKFDNRTVAVKQDNIIGTAFHPELSGDNRIHKHFLKLVSKNRNQNRG